MSSDPLAETVGRLIGRPWSRRFTCWHLVAEVQALRGLSLPVPVRIPADPQRRHEAFAAHPERRRWRRVSGPETGAVVLMSRCPAPRRDEHAGVVVALPTPLVLHVMAPQGTILEEPSRLSAQGWFLDFYLPLDVAASSRASRVALPLPTLP